MKIILKLIVVFFLVSCNGVDREGELESENSKMKTENPFFYVIKNKILLDSLSSFDEKLKKKFNSNYIIIVKLNKDSIKDEIIVSFSQILNRSEIRDIYPSFVVYSENSPVFVFTGFENLLYMPRHYIEMVDSISNKKLNKDVDSNGNSVPPITYTPIVERFVISQ